MVMLKSMQENYPLIDSIFLEFCGSRGIFTVEDFLISDLNSLISFTEKKPNPERLKQGIDQVLSIVDGLHGPLLNGVELLKDAQKSKQTFLAYEGIDPLLHGVLREGFVTELVGPSSSGKTQVCLQAAATVAKEYASGVVLLDSGNSFSAPRIAHLVNQASFSTSKQMCSVRLLIVDSFSSLIIPLLGGGGPYGHAQMVSAGNLLKKIAHEYSICVLVTNHMVAGEGGSAKPALGESWKSVPHVRFLLSRDRETNTCTISVVRHPSMVGFFKTMYKLLVTIKLCVCNFHNVVPYSLFPRLLGIKRSSRFVIIKKSSDSVMFIYNYYNGSVKLFDVNL
ncbi:DNA repair protein RAD51 homolog 4-like isoform X2 [Chenopodium quinoa]|uniref:DNA repair protein RAD51 homolog 4-like isoform X2 n=1 Tax=Chenopodium quinoa TaxID=63459 RepID=UPI000B778F05|nr:DNA repair protein RAD51 homolog 4-like isoform X2 [Chenopodium quinoa]